MIRRVSGKKSTSLVTCVSLLLEEHRFDLSSERTVQDGVELLLRDEGLRYQREVTLAPGDVIDFMVSRLGVEVKLRCGLSEVTRQLHRYAQSAKVRQLLLVTVSLQLARVPRELNGKPVFVASLLRSCL